MITEAEADGDGKVCYAGKKKYRRLLLRQIRMVMGRSVMLVSRNRRDDY